MLLFDRRGEGDSEGDPNSLGWGGTKDLDAAVAFLRTRPDVDPERIGGIGRSVGGEMLLEFAAETDDLKAVVSEGAGIRSVREAAEQSGRRSGPATDVGGHHRGDAVFSGQSPPPNLKDLAGRIAPRAGVPHLRRRGQGGENLSADYYEVGGQAKAALEDGQQAHRRIRRRPDRIRAPRGQLLQQIARRAEFLMTA